MKSEDVIDIVARTAVGCLALAVVLFVGAMVITAPALGLALVVFIYAGYWLGQKVKL